METIINNIFDKFENFIKRAFLPSFLFYVFLFFFNYSYFYKMYFKKIININDSFIIFGIFIILSIGISYIFSFLQQILIDDNLKTNFETFCIKTEDNKILIKLREMVINEMKEDKNYFKLKGIIENANDYLLYRILIQNEKITGIKNYVDEAKTYGIMFISFYLALIFNFFFNCNILNLILLLVFIILYFIFLRDILISRYRMRNIRLYIDYLKN